MCWESTRNRTSSYLSLRPWLFSNFMIFIQLSLMLLVTKWYLLLIKFGMLTSVQEITPKKSTIFCQVLICTIEITVVKQNWWLGFQISITHIQSGIFHHYISWYGVVSVTLKSAIFFYFINMKYILSLSDCVCFNRCGGYYRNFAGEKNRKGKNWAFNIY